MTWESSSYLDPNGVNDLYEILNSTIQCCVRPPPLGYPQMHLGCVDQALLVECVMNDNPYGDLPPWAFWKTGVVHDHPTTLRGLHSKKFEIPASAQIAAAGSCFAQPIARHLKQRG
jgi:hypothetical protein